MSKTSAAVDEYSGDKNKKRRRWWWGWWWTNNQNSTTTTAVFLVVIGTIQLFLHYSSIVQQKQQNNPDGSSSDKNYDDTVISPFFEDDINGIERWYYVAGDGEASAAAEGSRSYTSSSTLASLLPSNEEKKDVVIGGAGMAGISAGKTLSELAPHLSFVILEASSRVGGRISSFRFGDAHKKQRNTFEIGANWLDARNNNPLADLVTKHGISGHKQTFAVRFYDEHGNRDYDEERFRPGTAMSLMYKVRKTTKSLLKDCFGGLEQWQSAERSTSDQKICDKIKDNDMTVKQLYKEVVDWDPPNTLGAKGVAAQFFQFDFEYGASTDVASAIDHVLPNPSFEDFGSGGYLIADRRGFSFTAKALGAQYLATTSTTADDDIAFDDDRLILGSKVVLVKWDPEGKDKVEVVRCETEKVVRDDGVIAYPCSRTLKAFSWVFAEQFISTFSVEVLKKTVELEKKGASLYDSLDVAPRFYPHLSSTDLGDALNQNALGMYTKIFFQFAFNFWGEKEYAVSAYSTDGYIGEFAPVWQNYDSKGLYPGSGVLALYSSGARARQLGQLSDEHAKQELLPVLNLNYRDEILEMYGRELVVDDILDFRISRWAEDPLFYGGFTFSKFGEKTDALDELTRRGMGNLYFSGENTCYNYSGYVHGALFAGNRTVRMLLNEQYPGFESLETRTLCDSRLTRDNDDDSDEDGNDEDTSEDDSDADDGEV